jgi:hypothetical protein
MTKETVTYREQNNVKRNDFLQLLIQLKEKAEDVNNSKDKSIPWYKSKYHMGLNPLFGGQVRFVLKDLAKLKYLIKMLRLFFKVHLSCSID